VKALAEEAGRDPTRLTMAIKVNIDYGLSLPTKDEEKTLIPSNDAERMVSEFAAWRAAGADHVILGLNVNDTRQLRHEMIRISEQCLTHL
jgi:hypothetical protein